MKKLIVAGLLLAAIGVLAGCGGPKTVKVEVKDMAFKKTEITLKAGVPVRLELVNRDQVVHDLSIDTIPVAITAQTANAGGHDHGGKEPDFHVSAKPGEKGWIEFTPAEAGTYTFYCTVDGHKMEGTLIVAAK